MKCTQCNSDLILDNTLVDSTTNQCMYRYSCPSCGSTFSTTFNSSDQELYPITPSPRKHAVQSNKVDRHKDLCLFLNDLYAKKNADYGDSFHISYKQEGMAMPRIRLGDKYNRFCSLSRKGEQQVKDESIRDTLLDLANYALMTVLELDDDAKTKIDN